MSEVVHVFRWDLDKTYLRTEFDSIRDLWRSATERASDKKSFPGASALLRSLRQSHGHRICIVSGSPSQMRSVLTAKLALDGVDFDEFVLKNNLRNITKFRFRALRSQIPYKLPALLESRSGLSGCPPETLFGDDAEADAIIYCLYADILRGAVSHHELRRVMVAARAYEDQIERAVSLCRIVKQSDSVNRILIHLDRRSPTAQFKKFGQRLVPIYNYLQAALVLYSDKLISAPQVLFVARDMLASKEFELSTLANSFQDIIRRGRISSTVAGELCQELRIVESEGSDQTPAAKEIAWAFAERIRALGGSAPIAHSPEVPKLDYVSLVDAEYRRNRKDHR